MQKYLLLAILLIPAVSLCVAPTVQTGNLIIGIKDKPINGENVTAITLTIKSVQVHFSGPAEATEIEAEIEDNKTKVEIEVDDEEQEFTVDSTNRGEVISEIARRTGLSATEIESVLEFENETKEAEESDETEVESKERNWITVFEGSKTFNLLDYTGNIVGILGETSLTPGKYEQIRLFIDSATITVNGETKLLIVPSKVLKIVEGFNVEANHTLVLTLDFEVERSIKKENNNYILRPTIKILENKFHEETEEEIEDELGEELEDIEED